MKTLTLMLALLLTSASLYARESTCLEESKKAYLHSLYERGYDFENVYRPITNLKEFLALYQAEGLYHFPNALHFEAHASYISGFGIEMVEVDPKDCHILATIEIYAE